MTARSGDNAILLIHCPDQPGIVAAVSRFIQRHGGNILHLDQHVDREKRVFFMRVEWELDGFDLGFEETKPVLASELAESYRMDWSLHHVDDRPRMAIFVSRLSHCLYDLLARVASGEWNVEVPLIVSNHPDLGPVAAQFGIDFHCLPITPENKREQERRELELLEEHGVELIVLARYMQVVTGEFIARYPHRIINIHHSFLPAFPGARPYHSAFQRGVKIVGATSHYVTEELDAGPIIEQDVVHVSHKDGVADLIRRGRDLEKVVLSRAVFRHLQRRVLVYDNKTVVFA